MRILAIGTKKFVFLYKALGAESIEVSSPNELIEVLEEKMKNHDIGLIVIEEELANKTRKYINQVKFKTPIPVIIEMPNETATGLDRFI